MTAIAICARAWVLSTVALLLCASASAGWAAEGIFQHYPEDFQKVVVQIVKAYHDRDFPAVMQLLDEADKIVPGTALSLNTRGAIAIEEHRFEDGEKYCKLALEKDPTYYPAQFDLAEIPFMQKRYDEARRIYEGMLAKHPHDELLQFRIFLTYLLEHNDAQAGKALAEIKFPSSTAAYYYAHAAWDFQRGNGDKAKGWVRSGDWVFSRTANTSYQDVFYDLGWLERPRATVITTQASK